MLVRLAPSLDRHERVASDRNMPPPRRLHNVAEAAQLLGIGRTTLYALIKSGELETVNVGRRRFVAEEQVSAFISRAAR